jgi:hypothetical protein
MPGFADTNRYVAQYYWMSPNAEIRGQQDSDVQRGSMDNLINVKLFALCLMRFVNQMPGRKESNSCASSI